MNFKKSYNS